MAITHNISSTFNNGGGQNITGTNVVTPNSEVNVSLAVASGAGVTKNVTFNPVTLQDVFIMVTGLAAGQTAVFTTYSATAAGGSTLDTITLTQGIPVVWITGQGSCPLQVVTTVLSLKLVQSNGVTATLEFHVGVNG